MTKDYLVLLDACVLVGGGLRDTLLRLAETPRLYVPKWSDDILNEMSRTLERKFSKTQGQVEYLRHELHRTFPEAWVHGYKDLEPSLKNHEKDRHVLAAAIRSGAQTIVTFNLKDFLPEVLAQYDVEAMHPDEFLVNQFHLDDALVTHKFTQQAMAIGRTPAEQLRAFDRMGALPIFTQTLADELSINLAEEAAEERKGPSYSVEFARVSTNRAGN
jgi:predicted nucleic acid-binding protein